MLLVFLFRKADAFTNFEEVDLEESQRDQDNFEDNQDDEIKVNYKPENTVELEKLGKKDLKALRQKHLRDQRAKSFLREIFTYSLFLAILFVVAFMNKDTQSFNFQNQLKSMFGVSLKESSLDEVITIQKLWEWSRNYFLPAFNSSMGLKNYMKDDISYIIGTPVMRQLRVKNGKTIFKFKTFKTSI